MSFDFSYVITHKQSEALEKERGRLEKLSKQKRKGKGVNFGGGGGGAVISQDNESARRGENRKKKHTYKLAYHHQIKKKVATNLQPRA